VIIKLVNDPTRKQVNAISFIDEHQTFIHPVQHNKTENDYNREEE
jgi:hypothetical protein